MSEYRTPEEDTIGGHSDLDDGDEPESGDEPAPADEDTPER
jgi:hypothetical protein